MAGAQEKDLAVDGKEPVISLSWQKSKPLDQQVGFLQAMVQLHRLQIKNILKCFKAQVHFLLIYCAIML